MAARGLGRLLLAFFASLAPARHWPKWDLPAATLAPVSAMTTVAVGLLVGLDGFLRYAAGIGETMAPLATENAGGLFSIGMGISALSLPTFALLTPLGLFSTYLFASGILRGAMAVAGSPGGDPLLTLADGLVHPVLRERAREREAAARSLLEGPEVADALVTGAEAGIPEADWVVVASRLKPGWERGVFVVTTDRWWRLGAPRDRRGAEGLRALYPLHAVAAAEVMRRSVYYDHPRLSALALVSVPAAPDNEP